MTVPDRLTRTTLQSSKECRPQLRGRRKTFGLDTSDRRRRFVPRPVRGAQAHETFSAAPREEGLRAAQLPVARFCITSEAPTLIDLLDEVSDAWPDLSFEDFRGGYILSDILIRFPDQIRVVAEGMPKPGDDPLGWLDRVIALTSPTAGHA
jgi:hypothetical protein